MHSFPDSCVLVMTEAWELAPRPPRRRNTCHDKYICSRHMLGLESIDTRPHRDTWDCSNRSQTKTSLCWILNIDLLVSEVYSKHAKLTLDLGYEITEFRRSMSNQESVVLQMTSVFLHAFPALVAWTGRWHSGDPNHWKGPQENACQGENAIATVRELILVPWVPYALWAVAYYLKIFVVSSQRIQDRGYHTLFKYTTRKPNSLAGKVVSKLPRWVAPLAFMANHVLFCAVTFALAWLMWSHYWINTLFLIWCIAMSAWNGGNYYFEVFAHQYATETGISKPVKGSKPAQGGAVADGAQPRPHSIDGTSSRTSAGAEVKGVMRSQSDGALTTEDLVEEMEYLEQQMTQWEEQQMNGDASMSGASAEGGVSRGDLSVASHPAGDEDVDPSVFAKVNSYPVNSIELPVTPGDDNAGALDDGVIRRRAGAEQSGVGGAAG